MKLTQLNLWIAALLLALSPLLHADNKCETDTDPNHRVAGLGVDDQGFELDDATVKDLGLADLTYPTVALYMQTSIGQMRLWAMLKHPLIDPAAIRARQAAVQELVQNKELRGRLREFLTSVQKAYASDLPEYFKDLRGTHRDGILPALRARAISTGVAVGMGVGGILLALHPEYLKIAGQLLSVPVALGGANIRKLNYSRSRISPLKPVVSLADRAQSDLQQMSSEYLRDLGRVLSATRDSDHPLQLTQISQTIRKMLANRAMQDGLSLLFLLNGSTQALRAKVLANRDGLETLLASVADLDVLVGLADLYEKNSDNYSFPEILDTGGESYLSIVEGHHPYLLAKLKDGSVANDLEMGTGTGVNPPGFLLLTGPNTGGKSTYLRMLANNVVLAQIGAPVAAKSMRLTPLAIMTNMNVQDALDKSQSFFFAQAARVEKILTTAAQQPHMLIIMDEILNGTSPEEHTAIEQGIIKYLVDSKALAILATHDRKLQALEQDVPGVINIHVDDKGGNTFTIKPGPSLNRNALQILRETGFPAPIVDSAKAYLSSVGVDSP